MVKLTIDQIPVEVPEGISVMEAAAILGITIPSMCYQPGFSNHPSCMVCLVKDLDRDHLVASCAMPVMDGMNILTGSEEVIDARREALELLLSDHVGDCEAPCRLSCPAYMDIPLMNRLIASGDFEQALRIVREEIALPLILGYICPAPCEKACKRKPIDQAVSICLLKRSAAQYGELEKPGIPLDQDHSTYPSKPSATHNKTRETDGLTDVYPGNGKKVAIIGTGPAGLSAAFYLLRSGHEVVLYDLHKMAGGAMRCQVPGDLLPHEILDTEIEYIRDMGAEFRLGTPVTREFFQKTILREFHAVMLTTGNLSSNPVDVFGIQPDEHGLFVDKKNFTTSIPGVFACGNIIREQKMAVQSVAHGKLAAKQVEIYLEMQSNQLYNLHGEPESLVINQNTENFPDDINSEQSTLKNRLPFNHALSLKEDDHASGHRHKSVSAIGHLFESEWAEYLKESIPDHRIEPAGGNLTGFTREEAIHEAKRCLHCDCRKPVSCKLRIYGDEYGAHRKRFAGPERKSLTRSVQHDLVVYETEKCIRCGLCVEITHKHGESLGLTFAGRGFDVRISVPFNESIKVALTRTAKECVEACPTGALAFKDQEERQS
jgi:NAD-dependent dihydropyrimidine dehydrogenase PreA subunit